MRQEIREIRHKSKTREPKHLGLRQRGAAYRKGGFKSMAALLSHSKGGAAGQTSQFTPHALPFQSVIRHPQRELHDTYCIISLIIEETVHPKMKISSKCTYPQAIQDLDTFSITSIAHQWILCSEWLPSE